MNKGFIHVIKVKYVFKDGNEMQGIELNLAPKVKKFVVINRDNAELLRIMGNGLIDWYNRADFGDDIDCICNTEKDKTYNPENDNAIHVNVL